MNNNAYKLVLIAVILNAGLQVHAGLNAYSNDMKECLFTNWPAGAVLLGDVSCEGSQLCYSVSGSDPALFAVCYNTTTLIPNFTAHVVKPVKPNIVGKKNKPWHDEKGAYAPNPQSSKDNYRVEQQTGLYPNYDKNKQQFISRGHLVANADFSDYDEKLLTFVNTNSAPQWQPFNGGNWAKIEEAVRNYSTSVNKNVYVFTGTGGQAKNQDNVDIKLDTRVVAPKYFWKVVCDPIAKGSIVFVGENSIGEIDVDDNNKVTGCNGKKQTKKKGVVYCYSLQAAKTSFESEGFKLPPLGPNCVPSEKSKFMDDCINVA